jgi:hypothetical protein
MYIFVIDAENRVTAHAATKPFTVPKGEYKFADLKELVRLAAGWPGARLVEIWNKLPGTSGPFCPSRPKIGSEKGPWSAP